MIVRGCFAAGFTDRDGGAAMTTRGILLTLLLPVGAWICGVAPAAAVTPTWNGGDGDRLWKRVS